MVVVWSSVVGETNTCSLRNVRWGPDRQSERSRAKQRGIHMAPSGKNQPACVRHL